MTSTLHIRKNTPSPSLSPEAGPGRASGSGPPVSVEALLVWAYRVQCADTMARDCADGPGEVVSQLGRFSALGSRVSGGGRPGGGRLHDDALLVHEAVCGLGREAARLAMVHARLATRPDPRLGARWRLEPEQWRLEERWPGTGEYLRVPVVGWIRSPQGTGPFVYTRQADRPDEVARDRAEWTAWRAALAAVQAAVDGRLSAHRLSGELPPPRPWDGVLGTRRGAGQKGA